MAHEDPPAGEGLAAFQRRYWAAWDACDLEATAECLDADFSGTFAGPAGQAVLVLGRAETLAMVAAFFARVRGERASWRRSGLLPLHRGGDEAAVAMRVECRFPDHPAWDNAELTVETYRRGVDGRWRLWRAHSERLR